ncbi:hypothetical protein WJ95_09485 [Burkholderia ubonensis]|uniref:ribbon-helix-helix domain-containing protein n=1 Tax=Burkholderia ubonensis TaxID=101571 RepID=UPI000756A115|nr:hypothetical protein WJ95_09485 [Burkholderia ubonensis]
MARPRSSNVLGKLTENIQIRIDADTRDELDRLAGDIGISLAEFIRDLLMIRAYGQDHMCRLHKTRTAAVAGTSPERDE